MSTKVSDRNVKATATQLAKRPSWTKVFEGHPKSGTFLPNGLPEDLETEKVFTAVFGSGYDKTIFGNACATRVSLGLLQANVTISPKAFNITNTKHRFHSKGIETSARKLQETLTKMWGQADVIVTNVTTYQQVGDKIGSRNGVYFIIGGFGGRVSGHATLWVGGYKNVIGANHYTQNKVGRTVYFWELPIK